MPIQILTRVYFIIASDHLRVACSLTIKERFNVMCQGKDMADAHPVVDSSFCENLAPCL